MGFRKSGQTSGYHERIFPTVRTVYIRVQYEEGISEETDQHHNIVGVGRGQTASLLDVLLIDYVFL